MTLNTLTTSRNYRIEHEYESVYLRTLDGKRILIGDFYGDPDVALIDVDEKWCAIGGCGLIIYAINVPFDEYKYEKHSSQFFELYRQPPGVAWVKNIRQLANYEIEITLEDASLKIVSFPNFKALEQ